MNKNLTRNLVINIGKDEYGKDLVLDFPTGIKHLLIAGATGSGKSTLLHRIISTLTERNSPENLRLILIDPKRVELPVYNNTPHLLTSVIVNPKQAILALKWTVKEVLRRFNVLEENKYRYIDDYKGKEIMSHIVIVIDEFSDLIQTYPKETEESVIKIVQMGYAVGVHIIISTSRPSTKVYTKQILDEITAHIAFQTGSAQDSKLIIGTEDAYKLRGAGDMLFRDGKKYAIRGQVDMFTYDEAKALVKSLQDIYKNNIPSETFTEEPNDDLSDDLYEIVKESVLKAGKVSTSYIQRKFGIGYSRSAGLIDMLEARGVIGKANGSKPREVIKK